MKITLVLLFTLLTLPVLALEDTTANREKEVDSYFEATPPKEMFQDLAEQMAKNLSPERRDAFKALLLKYLDIDSLTKAMKEAMVKNFTADELKALADFYRSPVAKSAMKKIGTYMADMMPRIRAELLKAKAKADQEKKTDA